MKKIIMLLTVAAMLATSVIGVSAVDYTADEDGKYTGVAYSGLTANEYYGVVVVKGTENATIDFNNKDNILYIDQVTADETGAITIPAFMTKGDELVEGTIFIGGAGLGGATNIGYLKLAQSSEPEKFIISGTVTGYAGTILPTVTVTDGTTPVTATVNADGTFSVEVPVLESGAYTLTATKTSHLSYTKANITAEATVNPELKVGDVDGTGLVDVYDIAFVSAEYNSNNTEADFVSAYDVDETGGIDVYDIAFVSANYNESSISE